MSQPGAQEKFRRWQLPWKERVCDEMRSFSHGTVLRSHPYPDYWEYNCLRLNRPMEVEEMIAAADRELAGCAHRFVDWTLPIPERVVEGLRGRGWTVTPLIFMLHDGRAMTDSRRDLAHVDYGDVRELRDIWHREDFGAHVETEEFHAQARQVAELAKVQVIAALNHGRPVGFAQVETHDGGSEVTQVFVALERRGAGLGRALTSRAVCAAAQAAPDVWICAERDGRPRRLYGRLGFEMVVETGVALRIPG